MESDQISEDKEKNRKATKNHCETTSLLVRHVKKDPFMTAVNLMEYANDTLGVNIKIRTARNILIKAGFRGRRPAKKPWISKKNRSARLKFYWLKMNKCMKNLKFLSYARLFAATVSNNGIRLNHAEIRYYALC
jgi:hypothetical protein